MKAELSSTGKWIKLWMGIPEAQRLVMFVARGTALDSFGHTCRGDMLPVLSELAWGDPEQWQRIPGAIDLDGEPITTNSAPQRTQRNRRKTT